MNKRKFLGHAGHCMAVAAAGLLAAGPAAAQVWPARPIHVLVSFAPGGLTDLIARALQPQLEAGLGQPVIIENRPGAGGTLAESLLARAPADGYTVLLSADSVPANPHLMQGLRYDSLKDLQPVSMLARIPLVLLVNNEVPARTVRELAAHATAHKGRVSYGSPGVGTSNHLYFEVFNDLAGIDMPHLAYKGGTPALTDLMGGHIQSLLLSATLAVPQARAGKVRALAVTGQARLPQLPEVPTFAEAGYPDFRPQQWTGLFVPAGTPAAVVERIHGEFAKALRSPSVRTRLEELQAVPVMSSSADFAGFLRRESDILGKLIKARDIKVQ